MGGWKASLLKDPSALARITEATTQDAPRTIELTPDERQTGLYSPENLQKALEGLHQDGLLLLKDVVDVSHVNNIRKVMNQETRSVLQDSRRAGKYNQGVNSNILQNPPMTRCLYNDVWFNQFVIQIANAYLGSKPITNFCTANNALAGTGGLRQPVHKDITFHHPRCPFYFIANIVLSDFSPANGSTEFWLGSHAQTTSADQVPCTEETKVRQQVPGDPSCNVRPEKIEERRKIRPPVQPKASKGDIMIRDLRTWHAGMPNESSEDRIMIAIGYQAPWYQANTQRLHLPVESANFFMKHGGQPVEVRANFVEDMEQLWRNYDFTFEPSVASPEYARSKL